MNNGNVLEQRNMNEIAVQKGRMNRLILQAKNAARKGYNGVVEHKLKMVKEIAVRVGVDMSEEIRNVRGISQRHVVGTSLGDLLADACVCVN